MTLNPIDWISITLCFGISLLLALFLYVEIVEFFCWWMDGGRKQFWSAVGDAYKVVWKRITKK